MAFQDLAIRVGHEGVAQTTSVVTGALNRIDKQFDKTAGKNKQVTKGLGSLKGAASEAAGQIPGLGSAMAALASPIGIVVAAVTAASAAFFALGSRAVELDTIQRKVNTVFGEGVKDIEEYADSIRLKLGTSIAEVTAQLSGVQDTLVPLGFVRDDATELTKSFGNLASALVATDEKGRSTEEGFRALQSALLGSREALVGYGIKILESDVKTEKAALGLANYTGEAGKQANVLATLSLAYKQSSDNLTLAEGSAASLKGQQAALNSELKESFDKISKELVPVMISLFEVGVNVAKVIETDIAPAIAKMTRGISGFFKIWNDFSFATADLALGDWLRKITGIGEQTSRSNLDLLNYTGRVEDNTDAQERANQKLKDAQELIARLSQQLKAGPGVDGPMIKLPEIEAPTIDFAVPRYTDQIEEARAEIMEAYEDLFPTEDEIKEMSPNIFAGMEEVGPMLDGVHEQLSKSQLEWLEYRDTIRATMKEAGAEIKDVAINALGELSMNIGRAIAEGESLSKVFGEAIKDLASQALQILGMGLLKSAFTPQALATFPANLGIATAGAALLGISAAIPVIGQGGGSASSGAAPSPGPTGGSSSARAGSAPSGLSDFAGDKPSMKVNVNIGGKDFINHVAAEIENENGRLG